MAMNLGSLRGPWNLLVCLVGLAALFVGERLVGGEGGGRWILSGLGALAIAVACILWWAAWFGARGEARRVERTAAWLSLGVLAALGLYLVGSDWVSGPVPVARGSGIGWRAALAVAWPILLAGCLAPLVFLQWSTASMAGGHGVEWGRVRSSAGAGAALALLLATLFLVNAVANRADVHTDLSYFRTTSPSDSSRSLVEGLAEPVEALLYFPAANDVLAEVEPYFDELAGRSERLKVRVVDRAVEVELAQEHRVMKDGTVVLVRGGNSQKIEIGDQLDQAKRVLRRLDSEFQTALLKLFHQREVVYLVTGHGERVPERMEGDLRPRIEVLKKYIESKNFTVKRLGLPEGLAERVPDDAAMLLWVGPQQPLHPGEDRALLAYLERGGRLLLLLDPEGGAEPSAGVLSALGLTFSPTVLAHSRWYVPFTNTAADRASIFTNAFSSHAASSFVSRYSRDLAIVFPTTGSLEQVAGAKARATFLVRSMPNTWADGDGDRVRAESEPLRVFQLAAAVSRKLESPSPPPAVDGGSVDGGTIPPVSEAKPQREEMRAVVFADADVFADDYIFFRGGNRYLLADVFRWLVGEDRAGGAPTREEDVPVEHTRAEEAVWFWLPVAIVPVLVLGIGMLTGWGRGRRRRTKARPDGGAA